MERFLRFFRFRRSDPPPQQEVTVPPPPPVPSSEPDKECVPTPVPVKKAQPTPPKLVATSKPKEVVRQKENQRRGSKEEVPRKVNGSKEGGRSKTERDNRSKETRVKTTSKESPRKTTSKEKPVNKRYRISSEEKLNRRTVSTPERPIQRVTHTTQRTVTTEMSQDNDKTTEVDPNNTKTEMTEKSEIEKRQTGVKKALPSKERTSMRRRMKDAAIASSRQIRRASNSLTDSAKKFSTFVSRPIKERSLNNFMERVKQRKERRLKQTTESMQLRESEDAFPTMSTAVCADNIVDPPVPSERSDKSEKSERSERDRKIGNKKADKIFPDLGKEKKKSRSGSGSKLSKRSLLSGRRRKGRDGDIFKDGRPFWVRAGKITQEEKNEITQDDLPLNAEVIIDVKNGKIDLPVLPNIKFKFDAYAPMETLRERDKIFFTHKMLFANTIRSMINTAESIVDDSKTDTDTNNNTEAEKTVEKKTECDETHRVELLPHPKYCTSYNRAVPNGKMNREPYEWTGKGVV